MYSKLPRSLAVILAIVSASSFTIGMYLEREQIGYLQTHPITVNLISGVIGFSTGLLVLSIGVNWWMRRSELAQRPVRHRRLGAELAAIRAELGNEQDVWLVLTMLKRLQDWLDTAETLIPQGFTHYARTRYAVITRSGILSSIEEGRHRVARIIDQSRPTGEAVDPDSVAAVLSIAQDVWNWLDELEDDRLGLIPADAYET